MSRSGSVLVSGEEYASPVLLLRVLVRRMNMHGKCRAAPWKARNKYILWHYHSRHVKIPRIPANFSRPIRLKSAKSPESWRRWAKLFNEEGAKRGPDDGS